MATKAGCTFPIAWRCEIIYNSDVHPDRQTKIDTLTCDPLVAAPIDLSVVISAVSALAAAWIAAGSTGLLAHPLRRILTLIALAIAILLRRPVVHSRASTGTTGVPANLALFVVICLAAFLIASSLPAAAVMGPALVLAFMASTASGQEKNVFRISSIAAAVFGIYRTVCTSVPWVWLMTDYIGRSIGSLGGVVTRQPLYVGPTFAGLDFLVLTGTLWALWLVSLKLKTHNLKLKTHNLMGLAILGGHLIYLIVISYAPQLLAAIPEPPGQTAPATASAFVETNWSYAGLLHKAIPWNLLALACVIHLLIIAAMFRWSDWQTRRSSLVARPSSIVHRLSSIVVAGHGLRFVQEVAVTVLAILLPVIVALYPTKLSLQGTKIVFYEKGFLNWLKPEHGQYGRLSGGMYGMLPMYLESLGARVVLSSELSNEDIDGVNALVLIFPDEAWKEGQLDRIWDFVRRGGSLMVLGEHTTRDRNGSNRFNEVLQPTAIRVQFDSGTFAVGGWLQSYEPIAHPMTAGIPDDKNQFGVVIGASLKTAWPANPLLIGRWGWSDVGDEGSDRAMMGNGRYDNGEKLGDIILVAEQRMGKGRIIAFGDTSSITNGINVTTHVFTSRLFGYLADGAGYGPAAWRQILGILISAFLVGLLTWRGNEFKTALASVVMAGSLLLATSITHRAGQIFPDGRYKSPNNLAYIDSSHIEGYNGESWRPDGVGGFTLTLMRNGYLTLCLPQLTASRLEGAAMLVSIAPSREFSRAERTVLKDFVSRGGKFILTVGQDEAMASRSILADFGFSVGTINRDAPQPEAMGHFKSPYLKSADKQVYVRFHAAWPIHCTDPQAQVIAYGRNNLPVIILRRFRAGKVVVIGDTCFAMNKNLEWEGGEPFEGMRENADFWQWFISQLRGQEMWIPPALQTSGESQPASSASDAANQEVVR